LRIYAGGEQTRRRDDNGVFRLGVDKVAKLGLALSVTAGNAHDIAMVLVAEILVLVDERLPHAGGVFFIDAEDDSLLEAVTAFLEELGDFVRDKPGALVEDQ